MSVDHSQDLLAAGMSVAVGVPAGGFILDGADHRQDAFAVRIGKDAGAAGLIELDEGLGLGMAGVALLTAIKRLVRPEIVGGESTVTVKEREIVLLLAPPLFTVTVIEAGPN